LINGKEGYSGSALLRQSRPWPGGGAWALLPSQPVPGSSQQPQASQLPALSPKRSLLVGSSPLSRVGSPQCQPLPLPRPAGGCWVTPNARGTRPTILLLPPLPLRPPPQQLVARRCRVVGLPNWLLNRLPLTAAPPSSCLPSHSMASPSRIAALVRALKKRGNCSEQPWAVKELADLVVESLDSRSAAVEAGAIPVLLRLL